MQVAQRRMLQENNKVHFSPIDKANAQGRFYKHVDKVHSFKVNEGAASNEQPDDVFITVE